MKWRERWYRSTGRRPNTAESLATQFKDYPPWRPARVGPPDTLSGDDLEENLADFLRRIEERLGVIAAFFAERGVDVSPILDASADPREAAQAVDRWLDESLPKRPFSPVEGDSTPNPDWRRFQASDRAGEDISFSFIADLGLLEGEGIARRDERFTWRVNREPDFRDATSFHRICLMKPGHLTWAPTVLEMDTHLLSVCHAKMAPRGNISGHTFGELLAAARRGGFDPL